MEFIVALCRLLANELRLRVHFTVAETPDITVNELADKLKIDPSKASDHVRLLADFGVLQTRPSGRFVHLCIRPGETVKNAMARGLNELLLKTWEKANPTPAHVWDWLGLGSQPPAYTWDDLAAKIMSFLTAYTHLRRLLLIRYLATHGPTPLTQLREAIQMSENAAYRQLDKLRRRGLLEVVRVEGCVAWRLVKSPQPPFQRRLHELVTDALLAKR
ncbi:MAG: helix-turn-helix domain-containing protein [Planctomycetes bacterium]|nr:helix-turn-helix domain-containing protein [Planctomycetota bacterium]